MAFAFALTKEERMLFLILKRQQHFKAEGHTPKAQSKDKKGRKKNQMEVFFFKPFFGNKNQKMFWTIKTKNKEKKDNKGKEKQREKKNLFFRVYIIQL